MPSPLVSRWIYRLRYGHAFPSEASPDDPLPILLALLKDGTPIDARDPTDVAAVTRAESILRLTVRPVYAYVGDLHPKLGSVGLIISGRWYRRQALGVTRCDSGGLASQKGAFACLTPDAAATALCDLSTRWMLWGLLFRLELFRSHGRLRGWHSYLTGAQPKRQLRDERDAFIRNMGPEPERRLWTWEARSGSAIQRDDVEWVALTHEKVKTVRVDLMGSSDAGTIRFIPGYPSAAGVHHFDEDAVVQAFMGSYR